MQGAARVRERAIVANCSQPTVTSFAMLLLQQQQQRQQHQRTAATSSRTIVKYTKSTLQIISNGATGPG